MSYNNQSESSLNIPGYPYLDYKKPNYEIYNYVAEDKQQDYFNIDEFDYKTQKWQYITNGLVRNSLELIVNLLNIEEIVVDFGDNQMNQEFTSIRQNGYDKSIKQLSLDSKIYGNGYVILQVDDNSFTSIEDKKIYFDSVDPNIVFSDYNEYNLRRPAKRHTIMYNKLIDNQDILLLITFEPGAVYYDSYIIAEKEPQKVNPLENYPELFEGLDYKEKDKTLIVETGVEYSLLQEVRNNICPGEYYGQSDINLNVISQLNALNRMANLADHAVTQSADPKMQLTEKTGKILKNVFEGEGRGDYTRNALTVPITLKDSVSNANAFVNRASYDYTRNLAVINKKMAYFESDGRGENKYIINDYDLQNLFSFSQQLKNNIYTELNISNLLIDPDIKLGNISGQALRRLLVPTLTHIHNYRAIIEPAMKRIAYLSLVLAIQNEMIDAELPSDLPNIEWKEPLGINQEEETLNQDIDENSDITQQPLEQ